MAETSGYVQVCPVGAHEVRFANLESSVETLETKVHAVELNLSAREERDKSISLMFTQIMDLLTKISDRVTALESKPSKLWDALVLAFVAAAGGGGFALVQSFLTTAK